MSDAAFQDDAKGELLDVCAISHAAECRWLNGALEKVIGPSARDSVYANQGPKVKCFLRESGLILRRFYTGRLELLDRHGKILDSFHLATITIDKKKH